MGWPVFGLPPWKKFSAARSRSSRSAQENGCSSLPCRGVLSFRSGAREASGSETPGVHNVARWCGGVAACGARAAAQDAARRLCRYAAPRGPTLYKFTELGYQEGRNFTFDYIQTPNVDGYDKSYLELAARKPDVFLAVGNEPALRAALSAADGKPIAFLAVDFDPLAKGYVANLSHPGGNVTGIFVREIELAAKRVEIAREAFPHASVIGIAFERVSPE